MTPDAQRITIAEACGWKEIRESGIYQNVAKGLNGCMPGGEVHKLRMKMKLPGANSFLVPDYPTDLNAMHEAENVLTERLFEKYWIQLSLYTNGVGLYPGSATAAQRAEAFLRAVGKWETEVKP